MAFSSGWAGSTEEQLWRVQNISDRGVLMLTDGRQLCFAGLRYAEHGSSKRPTTGIKQALDRKNLRVRGFVQESRGPLIDISNLKQIEVIP